MPNKPNQQLKGQLGKSYELFAACQEMKSTEDTFRRDLISNINRIVTESVLTDPNSKYRETLQRQVSNYIDDFTKNPIKYHKVIATEAPPGKRLETLKNKHGTIKIDTMRFYPKLLQGFYQYLNENLDQKTFNKIINDPKLKDRLKPYIEISKTRAFNTLDIKNGFLSGQLNPIIQKISDETKKHLKKTKPHFVKTNLGKNDFDDFCANIKIKKSISGKLSILPIQRGPRYEMLLKAILKKSNKLNTEAPGTISKETIEKLNISFNKTKEFVTDINGTMNYKIISDATENKNIQNIIKTLQKLKIYPGEKFIKKITTFRNARGVKLSGVKKELLPNEKVKKMLSVINLIKNKSPEKILKGLNAMGFNGADANKAEIIKQEHYYSKIIPEIREIIKDAFQKSKKELHATPKAVKIGHKIIGGHRSSTLYLIDLINQSYTENKPNKKKYNLLRLGLEPKQADDTAKKIEAMYNLETGIEPDKSVTLKM